MPKLPPPPPRPEYGSGFSSGLQCTRQPSAVTTSADNLRSADVVTADGCLVHCSPDENPEPYSGLGGGGGNFGIVTSLEYDLHQVGPIVTAGAVFYPGDLAS